MISIPSAAVTMPDDAFWGWMGVLQVELKEVSPEILTEERLAVMAANIWANQIKPGAVHTACQYYVQGVRDHRIPDWMAMVMPSR